MLLTGNCWANIRIKIVTVTERKILRRRRKT